MKYILTLTLVFFLGTINLQAQMDAADKKELKQVVKKVEKEIKKAARKAKKEERKAKKAKAKAKKEKAIKGRKKAIRKDEKRIASLKKKLQKGKTKGTLSPVDIAKINTKIDKLTQSIVQHKKRLEKL